VPAQKTEVQEKGAYLLCSEVSAPHNCTADDVNVLAFEEAAKIIGDHDAVEEFLAYDIWLLSDSRDLEVEKMESPLSKVTVPMLKVIVVIGERETKAVFEARIATAANQLVGNYSVPKHHVCSTQPRHGRLNHIFELVGVKYQPCPEPAARRMKKRPTLAVAVASAPLKKTSGVKRWKW
jgi:hypothetical protein